MTVYYVTIGNSDDKLTQAEWSQFHRMVGSAIQNAVPSVIHGVWMSNPTSAYQNACWCFEYVGFSEESCDNLINMLRERLQSLAHKFRQDSIAWTTGEVEFLPAKDSIMRTFS